jgi:hypothetical protein
LSESERQTGRAPGNRPVYLRARLAKLIAANIIVWIFWEPAAAVAEEKVGIFDIEMVLGGG